MTVGLSSFGGSPAQTVDRDTSGDGNDTKTENTNPMIAISLENVTVNANSIIVSYKSNTPSVNFTAWLDVLENGSGLYFSTESVLVGPTNETQNVTIPVEPLFASPGKYTLSLRATSASDALIVLNETTFELKITGGMAPASEPSIQMFVLLTNESTNVSLEATNPTSDSIEANTTATIPKDLASNTSEVNFSTDPTIVEADPVVEWVFTLAPGEKKTFGYMVQKRIAGVTFDQPSFSWRAIPKPAPAPQLSWVTISAASAGGAATAAQTPASTTSQESSAAAETTPPPASAAEQPPVSSATEQAQPVSSPTSPASSALEGSSVSGQAVAAAAGGFEGVAVAAAAALAVVALSGLAWFKFSRKW
ncbi:hypothetical protein HYS54_00710 [Candidatus Micrarchaeota archaeon]|nr:hypothetical protein [Candidatus Micrarchaeota archaeon]